MVRALVFRSGTFLFITHLTQRGVWGDEVSPDILFSPRGAGYARATWGKGVVLEGLQPSKPPAFRRLRKVSYYSSLNSTPSWAWGSMRNRKLGSTMLPQANG